MNHKTLKKPANPRRKQREDLPNLALDVEVGPENYLEILIREAERASLPGRTARAKRRLSDWSDFELTLGA